MPGDRSPALPRQLTSFIGRVAEIDSIVEALRGAPLVTLTGPGGCGKTRLAIEAIAAASDRWPDGVWWVDLSATNDPANVSDLVAETVGLLRSTRNEAIPVLARQLRDRRVLICLDNCEHLLGAAAAVASELVVGGAHTTVLATSRERLGIAGEVVWRVPPLSNDDAFALFNARAGVASAPEAASAPIRAACAKLDGIPLAVELAAAWSSTMSPQEILDGLRDRFALLVSGPRGVPPRHRTLAASMAWSYDLLDEPDRVLFRTCGVFAGSFTAHAAAMCAGVDVGDVPIGLRRLIDKSLLIADTSGPATRYRMLETVRQYSRRELSGSGLEDAIRDRHLDVYVALAESSLPMLDTDKDAWRAAIAADYQNYRRAIQWGLSLDDAERGRRLAAAIAWLWHCGGGSREGLEFVPQAIARGDGERTALQARLLVGMALVADTAHPFALDYDPAAAALDIAEEVGDHRTARWARVLSAVGLLHLDLDRASELAGEVRDLALAAGDGEVLDAAQTVLGMVCHLRDDHQTALALLQPAAEGLAARGDRAVASTALALMALSSAWSGELDRGYRFGRDAVEMAGPLGDVYRIGFARSSLAMVCGMTGRLDEAWEVIDPLLRIVHGDEPINGSPAMLVSRPFVPGLTGTMGFIHLWSDRPERALEWYEHEARQFGPDAANHVAEHTRVGRAAALRELGHRDDADREATRALAAARQQRMPGIAADALEQLACSAAETDPSRSEDLHHDALAERASHGLRSSCVHSLEALAELAIRADSNVEGARLLGACDRAREEMGYPRRESGRLATPVGHDDDRLDGRAMSLDEAIAFARRSRGRRSRPSTGWASFTPTEQRVVALAVEGLSNPEIAQRLFMSRATVKTHLSHVFAKLGVTNRTQLAAAAAGFAVTQP